MSTIGSNTGRYTLCPFYKWNYEARITCEDVFRRFDSEPECSAWMDMYCDNEWMKCPFAIELNEAYDRLEKGDKKALEKHKIDALESELRSVTIKLGKAQKRIKRQQKEVDVAEKQRKMYYQRWKDVRQQLDDYEKNIDSQIKRLVEVYEQRMAYVIDMFAPGKVIYEDDIQDWARDRAFALVGSEEEGRILWEVKFGEVEDGKKDIESSGDESGSHNEQDKEALQE